MENELKKRWMVSEEELDDNQYGIRNLQMDNYLVEGCAGSGKTILALHKAKEIMDTNKGTYLVIIYTKALRTFIEDGITSMDLDPSRVCHYDDLANSGFDCADYIIVDEVQDFSKERINKLVNMANKNFIFFGDDVQQLHANTTGNITLEQIKLIGSISQDHHKKLENNYRLPIKIAEFAQHITTKQTNLVDSCMNIGGETPLIIKYNSWEEELKDIVKRITTEGWNDVGILFSINDEVRDAKEYLEGLGIDVEYKYDTPDINGFNQTDNTLNFYTNKPKLLTYHSSKGLQFENVFLPSCNVSYNNNNFRDALYVAATRPYKSLIISYVDTLSPFLQNIPHNLYERQIR